VARIGPQLHCWFQVERKYSVIADGVIPYIPASTGRMDVLVNGGKDWAAIALLVPGRTQIQCHSSWRDTLYPSIDRANGRTGKWTVDEESKLKDAVEKHGGKHWAAITLLVPGRTKNQCLYRWRDALDPKIDRGSGRTGIRWTADEINNLKDAVQTHGGKSWVEIAILVPGRTDKPEAVP
jgi:myb proto-oncogene protein